MARLSPRCRQVLGLLVRGLTEGEVSQSLSLSRHTEHTYVRQLYQRTGVRSRAGIVAWYIESKGAGPASSDHPTSGNPDRFYARRIPGDPISGEGKDDGHTQATRDSTAAVGGAPARQVGDARRGVPPDHPASRGRSSGSDR
ncbi:MAG: helix-turn-helix transcriptional regulator [Acidobacteriota bacterium]